MLNVNGAGKRVAVFGAGKQVSARERREGGRTFERNVLGESGQGGRFVEDYWRTIKEQALMRRKLTKQQKDDKNNYYNICSMPKKPVKYKKLLPGAPMIPETPTEPYDDLEKILSSVDATERLRIANTIGAQCLAALDDRSASIIKLVQIADEASLTLALLEKHTPEAKIIDEIKEKITRLQSQAQQSNEAVTDMNRRMLKGEQAAFKDMDRYIYNMHRENEDYGYAAREFSRMDDLSTEEKIKTVKELFNKALLSKNNYQILCGLMAMVELEQIAEPEKLIPELVEPLLKEGDYWRASQMHGLLESGLNLAADRGTEEQMNAVKKMIVASLDTICGHVGNLHAKNDAEKMEQNIRYLETLNDALPKRKKRVRVGDSFDRVDYTIERKKIRRILELVKVAIKLLSVQYETADEFGNHHNEDISIVQMYCLAFKLLYICYDGKDAERLKKKWRSEYGKWRQKFSKLYFDRPDYFWEEGDNDGAECDKNVPPDYDEN